MLQYLSCILPHKIVRLTVPTTVAAIAAIATATPSSSWFHFFLQQLLHVFNMNFEPYASVFEQGGEGNEILVRYFNVYRLVEPTRSFPEINLGESDKILFK